MPNKSSSFSREFIDLAETAKALSHPARIAIIRFLLENGPSHCTAIIEALPLSQPAISRHLKELKNSGLLESKVNGVTITYRIHHIRIQKFCEVISQRCINSKKLKVEMFVNVVERD